MTGKEQRISGLVLFTCCAILGACARPVAWTGSLESFLAAQPEKFGTVMDDPEKHRVQIIYTQIDRDENNMPAFTSFTYRVDSGEYFYPASTVKLPTALLALEKLRALAGVDRDTTMLTGSSATAQQAVSDDPTSQSGLPSVGHYVRKILLVSDNDAFNRLYEFLGQQPLNDSMHDKGFHGTRIMHRLEVALSLEENRLTNPVRFVDGDEVVYEQGPQYSNKSYVGDSPILLGKAEIIDGVRVERPKDFAEKNAFPLQDLHDVLQALMFPAEVEASRKFMLSDDDYQFVYQNMSSYPGESGIAQYSDAAVYPEGYVKFLMFGGSAERIPRNLRIYNKVGDAYGFLTDAAYVIDLENEIEFILAATIYTNANETFNDNEYEYEEIGLPFLRDLGQAIYALELARDRKYPPDFSRFIDSE